MKGYMCGWVDKWVGKGMAGWTDDSFIHVVKNCTGFPGGSDGKEFSCSAGDLGSIPQLGRSPGEGNGYPLQHSCLENSMDRGAWRATVHDITKNQTRLSDYHFHFQRLVHTNPNGKTLTASQAPCESAPHTCISTSCRGLREEVHILEG